MPAGPVGPSVPLVAAGAAVAGATAAFGGAGVFGAGVFGVVALGVAGGFAAAKTPRAKEIQIRSSEQRNFFML